MSAFGLKHPVAPWSPMKLITLLFVFLLLGGCMSSAPITSPAEPEGGYGTDLYQQGVTLMEAARYEQAVASLKRFVQQHPQSEHQDEAWLALAYSQLRLERAQAAAESATQVIDRSEAEKIDYALYLRASALLSIRPGPSLVQAKTAIADLNYLGQAFPDSPYASQGEMLREKTLEGLADRELEAAREQLAAGNEVAALNRCRYLIENYSGSNAVDEALQIMVTAYRRLGLTDLAASTDAILAGRQRSP